MILKIKNKNWELKSGAEIAPDGMEENMRNAKKIYETEKKIEAVKEEFNKKMNLKQLDIFEEMDYRMYISDLYDELDELYLEE